MKFSYPYVSPGSGVTAFGRRIELSRICANVRHALLSRFSGRSLLYCCQPPPSARYSWTTAVISFELDLSERNLGLEEVAVGIQRVEQTVNTTFIPQIGETRALLKCLHEQLLLCPHLNVFAISDESIRDFAKCALYCALIADDRRFLLRLIQLHI